VRVGVLYLSVEDIYHLEVSVRVNDIEMCMR
jgi:hypothetical protein